MFIEILASIKRLIKNRDEREMCIIHPQPYSKMMYVTIIK